MRVEASARGQGRLEDCLARASNPQGFLSHAIHERGRVEVSREGETYLIVFRARRFGWERKFPARATVRVEDRRVVYESTPDSPRRMVLTITCEPSDDGVVARAVLELQTDPTVGPVAGWIFQGMLESALSWLVRASSGVLAVRRPARVSCLTCMFYNHETGRCGALKVRVEDPARPPCGGRYYLERPRLVE